VPSGRAARAEREGGAGAAYRLLVFRAPRSARTHRASSARARAASASAGVGPGVDAGVVRAGDGRRRRGRRQVAPRRGGARRIDARVVRGRCLPYGEGITYWPSSRS
jgi:hypothetical protein